MTRFEVSPSKDHPIAKWILNICCVLMLVITMDSWISSNDYILNIFFTLITITTILGTMHFNRYSITFIDEYIIITNLFGSKRKYKLLSLNKRVGKYRIFSAVHLIYYDLEDHELFRTRYTNNTYITFLTSIGFTIFD